MASKTTIKISNPDLHDAPSGVLTQDTAVGATTLNISATTWFSSIASATDYYYVVIGNYWENTTEIALVSAKTDSTFTVSSLKYSHSASDPVTYIPYNQVKVYGRTVTNWANNLVATIDIDCSAQFTTYEYNWTTYQFFVTTYYRSATTAVESDYSDETSFAVFTFYSAKKIIEAGLRKALTKADENPDASLGWNTLIDLLNEWLNEIATRKKQWQVLHTVSSPVLTTPWVAYIDKPTDLSVLEFITLNWTKLQFITKMRYNQLTYTSAAVGTPSGYTIKNDQIYFYPTPSAADSVVFEYYAMPAEVTSLTTQVKKEFATILIYFIAAQAAFIRNNEKRWNIMEIKYQQTLAAQIEDVTWYEQAGEAQEVEYTSIYWPLGWDLEWIL